ncbi:MAG: ferrochelatase, partial [Acidimicrobiales bacterium]
MLVMAHGTPAAPEEIEAFYTRIRRGHPPTAEQLADLRRRFDAIGGSSPLAARTAAQVEGISRELERSAPGAFTVGFGAKHTAPFIEDAAAGLAKITDRVVAIVLTPHRASMGSEEYLRRAQDALAASGGSVELVAVRQWWDAPGFAELMARRVTDAVARVRRARRVTVLF